MGNDAHTYFPTAWQPPPKDVIKINFNAPWHQGQAGLRILVTHHFGRAEYL